MLSPQPPRRSRLSSEHCIATNPSDLAVGSARSPAYTTITLTQCATMSWSSRVMRLRSLAIAWSTAASRSVSRRAARARSSSWRPSVRWVLGFAITDQLHPLGRLATLKLFNQVKHAQTVPPSIFEVTDPAHDNIIGQAER